MTTPRSDGPAPRPEQVTLVWMGVTGYSRAVGELIQGVTTCVVPRDQVEAMTRVGWQEAS